MSWLKQIPLPTGGVSPKQEHRLQILRQSRWTLAPPTPHTLLSQVTTHLPSIVDWRFIFLRGWTRGSCNRGGHRGRQRYNKHQNENWGGWEGGGLSGSLLRLAFFSIPTYRLPTITRAAHPTNLPKSLLVPHSSIWADANQRFEKTI